MNTETCVEYLKKLSLRNIYLFKSSSKLSISNKFPISIARNILWILPFSVSFMLTALL